MARSLLRRGLPDGTNCPLAFSRCFGYDTCMLDRVRWFSRSYATVLHHSFNDNM